MQLSMVLFFVLVGHGIVLAVVVVLIGSRGWSRSYTSIEFPIRPTRGYALSQEKSGASTRVPSFLMSNPNNRPLMFLLTANKPRGRALTALGSSPTAAAGGCCGYMNSRSE